MYMFISLITCIYLAKIVETVTMTLLASVNFGGRHSAVRALYKSR